MWSIKLIIYLVFKQAKKLFNSKLILILIIIYYYLWKIYFLMFFKSVTVDLIIKLKLFIIIINIKVLNNILNSIFCINIDINVIAININKGFFFKQSFFI